MLKATPPSEVEQKIRELARKAGQPVTQFLNPYMALIAEGRITLVPQVQQLPPAQPKAA